MVNRHKAFTLIEILVVLIIIGGVLFLGLAIYKNHIEKAKSAEAVITAGVIRNAEEIHKIETGTYVAADNTEDINKNLALSIVPKNYEYRVVGVTDDNFIIIAERIGKDIASGILEPKPIVVALDKSGVISGYKPPTVTPSQPIETGVPLGIPGEGGVVRIGGSGGEGSGGGSGGGGSSGGSGVTRSGGSQAAFTYNSDLDDALNLLEGTQEGDYFYKLITDKNINIDYIEFEDNSLAQWVPSYWLHIYPEDEDKYVPNTIYVNNLLQQYYSESAIAAVISHEALHADYTYNLLKWEVATMDRYGVGPGSLSWVEDPITFEYYLNDTLDQEYNAFSQAVKLWEEIKGTEENEELDALLAAYEQDDYSGGDPRGTELWEEVVSRYPTLEDY